MLDELLDEFKEKYNHIRVGNGYVILNTCFADDVRAPNGPRSFNLRNYYYFVAAYPVFGARFVEKYRKDERGQYLSSGGKPVVRKFDSDLLVLSCLCLKNMQYTALHEILGIVKQRGSVQGFTSVHADSIVREVKNSYPEFDETKDSLFMFSANSLRVKPKGEESLALSRLELHRAWYEQIINRGSKMVDECSFDDWILIPYVFPENVIQGNEESLYAYSYRSGTKLHTPVSVEFLRRKMRAYRLEYEERIGIQKQIEKNKKILSPEHTFR